MAIMLTGPSRSIFAFNRAMASSAVIVVGASIAAPAPRTLPARHLKRQCVSSSASGSGSSADDRGRVRRRLTALLHLFDLREHLVERVLDGIDTRLREMRQIAFGRRSSPPRDRRPRLGSLRARDAPDESPRPARRPSIAQCGGCVIGLAQLCRASTRARWMSSSSACSLDAMAAMSASRRLCVCCCSRDSARDPDFEIASAFFEPQHFCTDGRRTFDERGVRRTRFGRTRGERS